jgi:hypothetical protein
MVLRLCRGECKIGSEGLNLMKARRLMRDGVCGTQPGHLGDVSLSLSFFFFFLVEMFYHGGQEPIHRFLFFLAT